ncbi:MAG TPA: hypothetical protein VHG32_17120, partial [Thermoanaerobaculia bacterium]|nr:hypothetical protein [Thermoanaerobaculia bacterium]
MTAVPSRRLAAEAVTVQLLAAVDQDAGTVGELRQVIAERLPPITPITAMAPLPAAIDPEELARSGEALGYAVGLTVDPLDPHRFAAVLRRRRAGAGPVPSPPGWRAGLPPHAYANDPLRHRVARRLVPELRRFLQGELP